MIILLTHIASPNPLSFSTLTAIAVAFLARPYVFDITVPVGAHAWRQMHAGEVKEWYYHTCKCVLTTEMLAMQLALYPGHMGGSRKTSFGMYESGKLLTSHMSSMTMAISSPWGVVDSIIAPHCSASKIRMSDVYSTVGEYAADNNMMWSLFKIIVTYVSIMYASTPSPLAVHV